jgi:hypothetical protein
MFSPGTATCGRKLDSRLKQKFIFTIVGVVIFTCIQGYTINETKEYKYDNLKI